MLPRVILHTQVSVDGRIDHITGDIGLYYELAGRYKADAMLSGSNTVLAAFPGCETAPEEGSAGPPEGDPDDDRQLLVVPDSRGRVRNWLCIRDQPYWRDVVVLCSRATPASYLEVLRRQHVECIVTGDEGVDLRVALEGLYDRCGVRVVRVDSGGILNGALLRAGLVDEISLLIAPELVGGTSARSMFVARDLAAPKGVIRVRLTHVEQMRGDAVWLRYEVIR